MPDLFGIAHELAEMFGASSSQFEVRIVDVRERSAECREVERAGGSGCRREEAIVTSSRPKWRGLVILANSVTEFDRSLQTPQHYRAASGSELKLPSQ